MSDGHATAADVQSALPEPPSYSAVRALLRILEEKGHVRHGQDGPRYVYLPTVARDNAKRSALRHVMQTFFDDPPNRRSRRCSTRGPSDVPGRLDRLACMIDYGAKEGV